MTTVVVVDDQPLIRTGFRMVISAEADMEVVGEAGNGAEALEEVERHSPDVVLMDIRMPVMDGIEATRRIADARIPTRVLILTTFDLDEYAFAGLHAGASGFLLKDVPPQELISAIRSVAAGDAVVSPRITRELLNRYATTLPTGSGQEGGPLDELTAREREVLFEMANGLSNSEIAERLYLSEATVKTHVTRILGKLQLRDRVQAVICVYRHGLRRPDPP